MAYNNALTAYRETKVKTANQGQLIVMMYEKAVQHLDRGLKLLETNISGRKDPGKIEDISKSILKTQEIITELMVSLDFEQGGSIAKNLFALYTWFNQELIEANIRQEPDRMQVVRNMLNELRTAWIEVAANTAVERPQKEPAGLNIAG
ncbi:MAG: flagellar export chaperone FliS [Treponema sp.]|nr:flagellar export chaperone FliS [Treponema sp.]